MSTLTTATPPAAPRATVLITTKNRRDELRRAIASALAQTASPEVLVIDDGSTDGTAEMVRAEFPSVRLDRAETSRGYIVQRNRGAALASAPIIVSIDDDAEFPSPRTVEQTVAEFSDPRIAAVAMPYVNVNASPAVRQRAPDDRAVYIGYEYHGTAHALRRDAFLAAGGYRESLLHQTEEVDLFLRLLASGGLVRVGRADPIHHFESAKRDLTRQIRLNARNNVLYVWHNVPMPIMPFHAAFTTVNLLRYGVQTRRSFATIQGIGSAAGEIFRRKALRRPVPIAVYHLQRWLRARKATPIEEVLPRLEAALGSKTGPRLG